MRGRRKRGRLTPRYSASRECPDSILGDEVDDKGCAVDNRGNSGNAVSVLESAGLDSGIGVTALIGGIVLAATALGLLLRSGKSKPEEDEDGGNGDILDGIETTH